MASPPDVQLPTRVCRWEISHLSRSYYQPTWKVTMELYRIVNNVDTQPLTASFLFSLEMMMGGKTIPPFRHTRLV